jgi:hypothetical protein
MIASALGVIVLGVITTMSFYTARSFASLDNLADMDNESRVALDKMTREIRQASSLASHSQTSMVFNLNAGGPLQYTYLRGAEEVRQTKGSEVSVLLTGCKGVRFDVFQRNSLSGTFNQFPNITATNQAKVIQVAWTCSREIMGSEENIIDIQSAKIVIRK